MSYFKDSLGVAIIFGLLLAFFNESLWAQTPDQLIVDAVQQMYEAALDPRGRTDLEEVTAEVILPLLAVEQISKRVMSKHWRVMTPAQRARFLELFPKLLVKIHTKALDRIGEAIVSFPQNQTPKDGKTAVKMNIVFQGYTHTVVYDMSILDGEWKVTNMTVNGLNMIVNYQGKIRSSLSFVPRALLPGSCLRIPRSPECIRGKMDYLLDELDRRVNPVAHPDN